MYFLPVRISCPKNKVDEVGHTVQGLSLPQRFLQLIKQIRVYRYSIGLNSLISALSHGEKTFINYKQKNLRLNLNNLQISDILLHTRNKIMYLNQEIRINDDVPMLNNVL